MNPTQIASSGWLAAYCGLAFVAAIAGAELPRRLRLTHTRLQVAVSFVAGLMLGLALVGLLAHAIEQIGSVHQSLLWLVSGFVTMFLLQRFLPFHHHDVIEGNPLEPCGHAHSLAEPSARSLNWLGVALGLSLHSIFDGLAMAAAVAAGDQSQSVALGLGTALAVILHKPFGALAISTLMMAGGTSPRTQRWVNVGFALVTPFGAMLFFLGAGQLAHSQPSWLGVALAFCAGTFLCIACADLLPELQFHSHDRLKLSLALLAGIGVAVLIARFGHVGHEHENQHKETPAAPAVSANGVEAIALRTLRDGRAPVSLTKRLECGGFGTTSYPATVISTGVSIAPRPSFRPQSPCLWTC